MQPALVSALCSTMGMTLSMTMNFRADLAKMNLEVDIDKYQLWKS